MISEIEKRINDYGITHKFIQRRSPLKVLFTPNFRRNPYQRLLADSLSKLGARVTLVGPLMPLMPLSLTISVTRNWRPDILHIHWTYLFFLGPSFIRVSKLLVICRLVIFIVDLLIIRLLGIRVVWTVHNKYNHERRHIFLDVFASIILAKICSVIEVGCYQARSEIVELFRFKDSSKVKVVLNGTDGNYIGAYPNRVSKRYARNQLGIDDNDFVFLYIGMIRPYKGVLELIDAFKRLGQAQGKLIIVGKPFDDKIKSVIYRKCVGNARIKTFLEFIPDNEFQIYLNAADVIILPFRDIFTSSSITLAMSFAKPVIAPAMGCIPEVLDGGGQAELLYDPLEQGALLKKMEIATGVDLEKIGKDNFRRVSEELNWSQIAQETMALYQSCLKKVSNR